MVGDSLLFHETSVQVALAFLLAHFLFELGHLESARESLHLPVIGNVIADNGSKRQCGLFWLRPVIDPGAQRGYPDSFIRKSAIFPEFACLKLKMLARICIVWSVIRDNIVVSSTSHCPRVENRARRGYC
jgi:hypothetical protein